MLEKDELLPWLIKEYNCGEGVEVGVRDGQNAERLLRLTNMFLYGIDINKWPEVDNLLFEYHDRFRFYQTSSALASDYFCKESLDFIYIDADHKYESVKTDLKVWYPKLKVGGVFCGDDYCNCWNPLEGHYGIVQAVEEFIENLNVKINISGLENPHKNARIAYANAIGKLHEDNLVLGASGYINIDPKQLENRVRTEGAPVPQWWFIKK